MIAQERGLIRIFQVSEICEQTKTTQSELLVHVCRRPRLTLVTTIKQANRRISRRLIQIIYSWNVTSDCKYIPIYCFHIHKCSKSIKAWTGRDRCHVLLGGCLRVGGEGNWTGEETWGFPGPRRCPGGWAPECEQRKGTGPHPEDTWAGAGCGQEPGPLCVSSFLHKPEGGGAPGSGKRGAP